jgi:antitoxin component HigA of HigAB toxin-antitoxin module
MLDAKQIVEAIKSKMEQDGISRNELAVRLKLSNARISDMLNWRINWTVETLCRVCKAVGLEVSIGAANR